MALPFKVTCCILGARYGVAPHAVAEWPADWWGLAAAVSSFMDPGVEQAPHVVSPKPPRME